MMQINNSNILFSRYSKQDQLTNQEKKQKGNVNDTIKKYLEEAFDYSEEEEQQLNSSISVKLKTGARLTPKEIMYLQKKNPILYMKVMMLQKKREILEQKLKNCKSKKEVNDVIAREVSLIQKEDPDRDLKLKTVLDTEKEFKKTDYYKRLPETKKKQDK